MSTFPEEKVIEAVQGLRGIAHELRLMVLCQLLDGPMSVGDLVSVTGASQSNLSQHLAKMRMMGLIAPERRGQQVYYRLARPEFTHLVEALRDIYCPEWCHDELENGQ